MSNQLKVPLAGCRYAAAVAELLCLLGSATAGQSSPDRETNAYHAIVERNLFRLTPPTPASPLPKAAPAPAKIVLTGITTILGDKEVLMKVWFPAAEGQPPIERLLIL